MLAWDSLVVSKNNKKLNKKVAVFHWGESGPSPLENAALPAPTAAAALPTIVSSLGGSFCVHGTFSLVRLPLPSKPKLRLHTAASPSTAVQSPQNMPPFLSLWRAGCCGITPDRVHSGSTLIIAPALPPPLLLAACLSVWAGASLVLRSRAAGFFFFSLLDSARSYANIQFAWKLRQQIYITSGCFYCLKTYKRPTPTFCIVLI